MKHRSGVTGVADRLATLLEPVVPRGSRTRQKLRHLRERIEGRPEHSHTFKQLVDAFAAGRRGAVFVQVGSNDGLQLDPLRPHIRRRRWRGVLVEPVPYVFQRLQQNYAGAANVALANVAIADASGSRTLYYLPETDDPDVPDWYDALASFRRDVLLKHGDVIPDIERRVQTLEVPCVTFDELCRRHGIDRLDLVHIDTEGYDFEVIKLIDLARLQPVVLMFEELHLDAATRAACSEHLAAHGYSSLANGMDVFAVRPDLLGWRDWRLARLWRQVTIPPAVS